MSRSQHHPNYPGVDQSDRTVPGNPRQPGDPDVDLVISTRVRKSPFRHRSVGEGRHETTVYNHMYHPRAYIDPEDGGAEAEYDLLVNHLITRDGTDVEGMRGKYAICCNQDGGILDDFALLCPDEVRFSIAGSDLTAGARERATVHAKADTDE